MARSAAVLKMPALGGLALGGIVDIGGRQDGVSCAPGDTGARTAPPAPRADVDDSIQAIFSAGSAISAMAAKMRTYEKIIFALNKTVAEHRSSEETSYQRAVKAEARAKDAEEQIRRLELREKTALDHLDRAMKAVDTSFVFSSRLDQNARLRP